MYSIIQQIVLKKGEKDTLPALDIRKKDMIFLIIIIYD